MLIIRPSVGQRVPKTSETPQSLRWDDFMVNGGTVGPRGGAGAVGVRSWVRVGVRECRGPSVTECTMLKNKQ